MKKFIVAVTASFALMSAFAEAETKKVCKDKTDKAGKLVLDKAGKPQQECKTIKVHKKLEGTKVEDAKKK
jgi:hypothetical protein